MKIINRKQIWHKFIKLGVQRLQRATQHEKSGTVYRRIFHIGVAYLGKRRLKLRMASLRNFHDGHDAGSDGHSHVRVLASFHEPE